MQVTCCSGRRPVDPCYCGGCGRGGVACACRAWSRTTETTIILAVLCCTRLQYPFVVGNAGASDHLCGPKRLSRHHVDSASLAFLLLSTALEVALPLSVPVSITTSLGRSVTTSIQTLCLFHWFLASNVVCPHFISPRVY